MHTFYDTDVQEHVKTDTFYNTDAQEQAPGGRLDLVERIYAEGTRLKK